MNYDIFLSYAHEDVAVVEAIAEKLKECGVHPFFDRWDLVAGQSWPRQLEVALQNSACMAAFISGNGWWSNAEREAALVRAGDDATFRVIPVIVNGTADTLPPFLKRLHAVDFTAGPHDTTALAALIVAIRGRAETPEQPSRERLDAGIIHALPAAPQFVGRSAELKRLEAFWDDPTWSVASLIGLGGAGKTAVASEFLNRLLDGQDRPDELFVWSFYNDHDVANFLRAAKLHFGLESSSGSGSGLLYRLNERLGQRGRTLIVLDGLERVQRTHSDAHCAFGEIEDPLLKQVLTRWAAGIGRHKCLVTSRFPVWDLHPWNGGRYRSIDINELAGADARALLRRNGVIGTDFELDKLIDDYGGHALVMDHLGIVISTFYSGQARYGHSLPDPNVESYVPQERKLARVLRAYEQWLQPDELQLLERFCIFRFGATVDSLHSIFAARPDAKVGGSLVGRSLEDIQRLFSRLEKLHLVVNERDVQYTAHPAIRDHFYRRLTDSTLMHSAVGAAVSESWEITIFDDYAACQKAIDDYRWSGHWPGHEQDVGAVSARIRRLVNKYRRHLLPGTVAALNAAAREFDAVKKTELPPIRTSRVDLCLRPGSNYPDEPKLLDLLEEVIYQAVRAGKEADGMSVYENRLGGMRHLGEVAGEYARGYRILRYFRFTFLPARDLAFFQRALGSLREAFAVLFAVDDGWLGTLGYLLGYLPLVVNSKLGWPQAREIAGFLCGRTAGQISRTDLGWGEGISAGQLSLIRGDIDGAAAHVPDARASQAEVARHHLVQADVARQRGQLQRAQSELDEAAAWIMKSGSAEHLAEFHLGQGKLHGDLEEYDAAEREIGEGLAIARRSELALAHIDLLNARGWMRLACAEKDRAIRDALVHDALEDVRIALNGVGTPMPVTMSDVESAIIERNLSNTDIKLAADLPTETCLWLGGGYGRPRSILDLSLLPGTADESIMGSRHPDCQYVWGTAAALRVEGRAHALLGDTSSARRALGAAAEMYGNLDHFDAGVVLQESREVQR